MSNLSAGEAVNPYICKKESVSSPVRRCDIIFKSCTEPVRFCSDEEEGLLLCSVVVLQIKIPRTPETTLLESNKEENHVNQPLSRGSL